MMRLGPVLQTLKASDDFRISNMAGKSHLAMKQQLRQEGVASYVCQGGAACEKCKWRMHERLEMI